MAPLPLTLPDRVCEFGLPIRLLEPRQRDGNVSSWELIILNHIVARRNPATVFEIGTFDGRTTINLAANAPSTAKIYTLDLPRSQIHETGFELGLHDRKYVDKQVSGARFLNTPEESKITQLLGDSASFDFTHWYGTIDLVFVDGSHADPYVRSDTQTALDLIGSRDGVILWHDYGAWPDVTSVLDEYSISNARFKNMAQILDTSLVICEPNGPGIAEMAISAEAEHALAYWRRYPDVAASDDYGQSGRLRLMGARLHFEDFGRSEGRVWAR